MARAPQPWAGSLGGEESAVVTAAASAAERALASILQDVSTEAPSCRRNEQEAALLTAQQHLFGLLATRDVDEDEAKALWDQDEADDAIQATVRAADSGMGQKVMNDLFLSFFVDRVAVGRRKAVLLPSRQREWLGQTERDALQRAHALSMRGASALWEDAGEDASELHKIVVLLAGTAVRLSDNEKQLRNDEAFAGTLCLPFTTSTDSLAETADGARDDTTTPLDVLVCTHGSFFLVSTTGSRPRLIERVLMRGRGAAALADCLALQVRCAKLRRERATRRRS